MASGVLGSPPAYAGPGRRQISDSDILPYYYACRYSYLSGSLSLAAGGRGTPIFFGRRRRPGLKPAVSNDKVVAAKDMIGKTGKLERFFGATGRSGWAFLALAGTALAANWLAVLIFVVPRLGRLSFLRLHYTAMLGVDWEAEWWKLFIYPGTGLAVLLVNGFFAGILATKHRMLGLVTLGATVVVELLLAAGGIIAVQINY